jgi:hypothetical protein
MKALLPTSNTMEIDVNMIMLNYLTWGYGGSDGHGKGHTSIIMIRWGSYGGANKDVGQGYKVGQHKEACNEARQELGQGYKIGQDKKTCNEAR